jgi:hypothetical protein
MAMTASPFCLNFDVLRNSGPKPGSVDRPAMPPMERASAAVTRPLTTAHSPSLSRVCEVMERVAMTGMPLSAWPVSTFSCASTDTLTSPPLWTTGVTFNTMPRSSNVNVGGGR